MINSKRVVELLLLQKNYGQRFLAKNHLNFDKWKTFYIRLKTSF